MNYTILKNVPIKYSPSGYYESVSKEAEAEIKQKLLNVFPKNYKRGFEYLYCTFYTKIEIIYDIFNTSCNQFDITVRCFTTNNEKIKFHFSTNVFNGSNLVRLHVNNKNYPLLTTRKGSLYCIDFKIKDLYKKLVLKEHKDIIEILEI